MNCCINCFNDLEIKEIIRGVNTKGSCDLCGIVGDYIYNTNENHELTELFDGLLDIYLSSDKLSTDFPPESQNYLGETLKNQWDIFTISPEQIQSLLKSICHAKFREHPELFTSKIGVPESIDKDYLDKYSIIRTFDWEDFVKDIKIKNRFHTNHINKDTLGVFIEYCETKYFSGQVFYRARISPNSLGFNPSKMGAPPPEIAVSGRANAEGISCLYLADSEETAIYEIRAGINDFVSIGRFELKEDILVINLSNIDKISPFIVDMDYTQQVINIKNLRKIKDEIAKPVRKNDSPMEYLPTQYICDYIKSKGYKGIEYQSTMTKNGSNYAIFDEKLFHCNKVNVHIIDELTYRHVKIGKSSTLISLARP